jgi:hypothetical protein
MVAIIHLLATFIADVFKSRRRLEVENLFLRNRSTSPCGELRNVPGFGRVIVP